MGFTVADFDKISEKVRQIFQEKIDPHYPYHNSEHTYFVVDIVQLLGTKENLSESDIFCLKVAAVFHDLGYSSSPENHENKGIEWFNSFDWDIDQELKNCIISLIGTTNIHSSPETLLQKLICDADLAYLGTQQYGRISSMLRKEWEEQGRKYSDEQWAILQRDFLAGHSYKSESARSLFEEEKQKNLAEIQRKFISI